MFGHRSFIPATRNLESVMVYSCKSTNNNCIAVLAPKSDASIIAVCKLVVYDFDE